jgi:hypothetical protein
MREMQWISCQEKLSGRSAWPGIGCPASAKWLVVAGYDAGKLVCGTHARAYTARALQKIEYPAPAGREA